MDGEQFSLCWNNFHSNLSSGFHTLLKDEDLVDVTLAAEGRYLKAHKTILSVCSPFFKELFRVNPCKHPIVVLQDVNYGALCNLLQFMYQGEVSVSQEEIPTFMRVAETLKVKGLTDNSSTTSASNGVESKKPFGITEANSFMKRPRPVKKVIRPIQHLRPTEPPKAIRSPHPQTPQTQSSSQSSQSSQPPLKRIHLEEPHGSRPHSPGLHPSVQSQQSHTQSQQSHSQSQSKPPTPQPTIQPPQPQLHTEYPLLTPKLEPMDPLEMNSDPSEEGMSMAMLDTKMDEPSPSSQGSSTGKQDTKNFWKYEKEQDVSSPGTLQCILGRRGNPRLIVDGHVFYKKSTYKGKAFWYCKNSRTPDKCQAVCWTMNGNIVKWPYMHTHPVIPDVFNPDEDTEVPIESLQEVLWQTSLC